MKKLKSILLIAAFAWSAYCSLAAELLGDRTLLEKIPVGSEIALTNRICFPQGKDYLEVQNLKYLSFMDRKWSHATVWLNKACVQDVCIPEPVGAERRMKVVKVSHEYRPASSLRDDSFRRMEIRIEVADAEIDHITFETGLEEVSEEVDHEDIFGVKQHKVLSPKISDLKVQLGVQIYAPTKSDPRNVIK